MMTTKKWNQTLWNYRGNRVTNGDIKINHYKLFVKLYLVFMWSLEIYIEMTLHLEKQIYKIFLSDFAFDI